MNIRKPGLTLEQHNQFGAELAYMRDRLTQLHVEISNSYPKSANVGRQAGRAADQLDQLRSRLDGLLAAEYPDDFNVHIYYPTAEQRTERTNTQ